MKTLFNADYFCEYGEFKKGTTIDTKDYPEGLALKLSSRPSTSYTILEETPIVGAVTIPGEVDGLPTPFDEIDSVTVKEATALIMVLEDVELLRRLDNEGRLKGVRQAADARLQTLLGGDV